MVVMGTMVPRTVRATTGSEEAAGLAPTTAGPLVGRLETRTDGAPILQAPGRRQVGGNGLVALGLGEGRGGKGREGKGRMGMRLSSTCTLFATFEKHHGVRWCSGYSVGKETRRSPDFIRRFVIPQAKTLDFHRSSLCAGVNMGKN